MTMASHTGDPNLYHTIPLPHLTMDSFSLVHPEPNPYSPNYTYVFKFEDEFDYRIASGWMKNNWHSSFYWAIAYLTFIFFGKIYMSTRSEPFRLKFLLTIWNVFLASFSIVGTLRTWPEMLHVLNNFGFSHSVCASTFHRNVCDPSSFSVKTKLKTILYVRFQPLAFGPGCLSSRKHPNLSTLFS